MKNPIPSTPLSTDICTLLPQGAHLATGAESSVVDAALAAAVSVPFSCQRGACGSCAAIVVSGDYAPTAHAAANACDPGPGRVLMCQVRALGALVLEVPDWTPQTLPQQYRMQVLLRESLSSDVVRVVLDPGGALATQPGQHLRVGLEGDDHRCFSIANRRSHERDPIELQIRQVANGRFSDGALRRLKAGDSLPVMAPFGAADTIEAGAALVLLATGTGYAGVRALIETALADPAVPSVILYWGGRHAADHYASQELDAWAAADARLRWTAVAPEATKGHAGSDAALQRHVQDYALNGGHDWRRTRVHACGNPHMLRDARQALLDAGLPATHWKADAFVPSGRDDAPHDWERTSPRFERSGILAARERSIAAVQYISERLSPGMSSAEARAQADTWLRALGAERNWHPTIIRFGDDTTCTSRDLGDPQRLLKENDIVFIDIGPVWDGYEGDYGDTFVLGDDPVHQRCARAARAVFDETREAWLGGADGIALYAFAETAALRHGCTLVHEMAGHRIADFPHALYGRHKLAHAGFAPGDGLWVLEIQLRDRERPVGAFFEDVLLRG